MNLKEHKLTKVKWGVIGVGDVCEKKSAPAMQKIKNSELLAVMRRDGEKARDYANRHNVPKWYDDADLLIQDPEINAIYIATPPYAHLSYVKKAAAVGKAIYVEKPMARTYAECREMIEVCEQAGVPLFVAYYRRMLPNFLKLKSWIMEGAIGEIRHVQVTMRQPLHPDVVAQVQDNWRVDPDLSGGGYFYDLASHQLDLLDYLFGPIESVDGIARNQAGQYPAEDFVTGVFGFQNGIVGTGSWCFTSSKTSRIDQTQIIGSEGEISFPTFDGSFIEMKTDRFGEQKLNFEMPDHIQYPLIERVVETLLGRGDCPSTGQSAARTNWVMEEMTKTYQP
ncbi:Gfo/Idh/MocA family protein [Pleomorphovibrio marinus]|uniref:Gfo/Idh/MocA family protein n=1 Tax=Pleomorphovibrio marinus TaxID=2164132 RepID=UPI000E0ADBB8|nr:Gfo/Idh/MocA family oxidoreductase [Pleomorphovibrio marinus]